MKRTNLILLLLISSVALFITSCIQDQCARTITAITMEPVYAQMDDLRDDVASAPAQELKNPGKLYFKDNYVFIAEINEGVHIIDNSDPNSPQNVSFIKVPGVRDMAVKGNVMYVDSYLDLVSIDVSDPFSIREVGRQKDVFPYGSWHPGLWAEESQGIAIRFEEVVTEEEMGCADNGWGWVNNRQNIFVSTDVLAVNDFSAPEGVGSTAEIPNGIGGSMARFTLVGSHLYVVTNTDLQAYMLATLENPQQVSSQQIGWGDIETIFPMKGNLFIGSMNGMYIYSLSDPNEPNYVSEFQHVRSCDPVVVEGDFAYVTLRGGTPCGGFSNQLDVV
ncbi:MAG: hypothetical protein AAF804_19895, partial [Bacteroidota bacterium]